MSLPKIVTQMAGGESNLPNTDHSRANRTERRLVPSVSIDRVMGPNSAAISLFVVAVLCGYSSQALHVPRLQHVQASSRLRMSMMERIDNFLIGNLLSGEKKTMEEVDPEKLLAHFPGLAVGSKEKVASAHSSLNSYLERWGRLLENGDELYTKGLTTKVRCTSLVPENQPQSAIETSGIKLSFKPPRRYLSYREQKAMEKGILPDRKGAKVDAWSPGGVELLIQTISLAHPNNVTQSGLELLVRRCDIDGDTIIKFKSERTIVRRLDEAIQIWRSVRRDRDDLQS